MATGGCQVTSNDIEADAVPVHHSGMDPDGRHTGSCIFPEDNAVMPKGKVAEVSNSRLWQKKTGDVGLDFLKSLWDFSSSSTPTCLEPQVSVDGEKQSFSKAKSEEEDEFFQNDLIHGNRGPKKDHSSSLKIRGSNSDMQSQKPDRPNIVNNLEGPHNPLPDKSKSSAPTKPPRTGIRNSYEHVKAEVSLNEIGISDKEFDNLSEENYSKDDMLHPMYILGDSDGTNILIFDDDERENNSSPHYDDTNFDVKQRGGYAKEHPHFEGHHNEDHTYRGSNFEGRTGNNKGQNYREGNKPLEESDFADYQRQDAGNYRSFEAEANLPKEMLPPGPDNRMQISDRGGNPEANPFMNTFSEEIAYGNSGGIGSYSSELPNRRPHSSHEHSETCHDGNPMPAKGTTRNMQQSRQALLIRKGCGNCQICRETKMIDHMEKLADSAGFDIHDVLPDGNCMFRAIVDQLRMRGDLSMTAGKLRQNVVRYLRENPCSEDGTHMQMFLPTEKWEDYLSRMEKDGEWGDEMALRGISEVVQRHINIISALGSDQHNQITIQPSGVEADQSQDLFLGHMDDYHYISLRPKNWEDTWFVRARRNLQQTKPKTDLYADDSIRVSGMDAPVMGHDCVDDYFADDTAVDKVSATPIGHLSYVLKSVLNSKNLVVKDPQMWEDKMASLNDHPRSSTVAIAVGSIVEKFAVSVQDTSPVQIGYSLRKDKSSASYVKDVSPQVLILYPYYHVMEHDSDERHSHKDMVMDTNGIHSGYLRLRDTIKQSSLNSQGQVLVNYLPNSSLATSSVRRDLGSVQIPKFVEDNISLQYALECHFWPECASEWKTRERPSGWPKPEYQKSIIEDGFFVIAASHPHSLNPDLEYQICFGKAEKLLARKNMTKWQRYCFHIFKVLVDFYTRQTDLLQTHHLKAIFFYASEVVPRIQWRLNPGAALLYLMDQLLQCLRTKVLPHYFLRDSNMIDHFSEDTLQRTITHLEVVRQFPVTAVVLLAESHGLTSSWMSDPIIEDIPAFTKHRDLQKSFAEVFIPTTLKNAINYVKYMMFKPAADIIMEAYEDMKSASEATPDSRNEWGVGDIFEFIHQILSELHFFQQFWLCLILDLTHGTSTVGALTQRLPGKTIREILGNDEDGELDTISVPFSVMDNCFTSKAVSEDESDPEVLFIRSLASHLESIQFYDLSAHYLRAAVSLMKRQIAEITKSHQLSTQRGELSDISQQRPKLNSAEFSRQQVLKMHLNNFLVQLFNNYHYNGQTELFQEYIGDLQEVCDSISTPYAYKNLSRIWGYLGCDDMAQQASDRMEELYQLFGM
ncbi:uncharacterized protein LOC110455162 isoform X2 [Mizuhopecten yessoensis]|uniref:Ubiquitin thioesterase n=1 Tax=Mizuhopecten yessoensis TaxID=6573 RepID=A0A210QDI5_MIZYE|nr:uncharacterized protein LOC110455162 isoform X2 [Mizuhopecten yessoensis]OWF46813.1 Ubiquitin thioesterase [Mizuhopecten yessoensis]